jgi:hypothetical protein
VLDYQYPITGTTGPVANIRNVLTKAKWRWQEIDVVSTTGDGTATITIPLNEPLLKGLEWDVYYPSGTFTDLAGNPAAASDNTTYYFTTPGVQTPVIRVNRRSYDGRTTGWQGTGRTFANPTNDATWAYDTAVTPANGWGITNFNTVHYRVESESPGAAITVQTYKGGVGTTAYATAGAGLAIGTWTGANNVSADNPNVPVRNDTTWNAAASDTAGQWILSNIIRRSRSNNNQTYSVITKNGTTEDRTSTAVLRMFKSYNRDLTKAQLDGTGTGASHGAAVTLTTVAPGNLSNGQGVLGFGAFEASKSYVIASATLNGSPAAKGYEGIFRTVIMMNYSTDRNNFIAVEGSNLKNGMPSIAGFPVRDAEETGDNRFIKVFYSASARRFYWVSTEIVSEWYFLSWGNGGNNGTHQSAGEVNNYLMVGYGDLTYSFNVRRSGDNISDADARTLTVN